jgi:hypothetical protein
MIPISGEEAATIPHIEANPGGVLPSAPLSDCTISSLIPLRVILPTSLFFFHTGVSVACILPSHPIHIPSGKYKLIRL